jgi:hypothetical protein
MCLQCVHLMHGPCQIVSGAQALMTGSDLRQAMFPDFLISMSCLQVELQGMLSPASPTQPIASIKLVRELSMMNAGLPLLDIALVPPPHTGAGNVVKSVSIP